MHTVLLIGGVNQYADNKKPTEVGYVLEVGATFLRMENINSLLSSNDYFDAIYHSMLILLLANSYASWEYSN